MGGMHPKNNSNYNVMKMGNMGIMIVCTNDMIYCNGNAMVR